MDRRVRILAAAALLTVAAAACGGGEGGGKTDAGGEAAVRAMISKFGITEAQARCGVAKIAGDVLARWADADYELPALTTADAAIVYQAGVECVGTPSASP